MKDNSEWINLLEQAKTLRERRDELDSLAIGDLMERLDETLVSVGLVEQYHEKLSEKEQALRKLLENRPEPKYSIIGKQEKEYDRTEIIDWFSNFVREFEGLSVLLSIGSSQREGAKDAP